MDRSDCCRFGMMKDCCATAGKDGCKFMVALCVDVMVVPSGSRTSMLLLGCWLEDGADG